MQSNRSQYASKLPETKNDLGPIMVEATYIVVVKTISRFINVCEEDLIIMVESCVSTMGVK